MDSHLSFSNTKKAYSRKKILSYSNGKEDNRDFWFLSILRAALDLPKAGIRMCFELSVHMLFSGESCT